MTTSWSRSARHPARAICSSRAAAEPSGYMLCRLAENCAAAMFGVPPAALQSPSRGSARAAFARQVAMYLAHVGLGMNMTDIGIGFDRDRTTVTHACAIVEDSREDAVFDRRLERVEYALILIRRAFRPRSGEISGVICRHQMESRHGRA